MKTYVFSAGIFILLTACNGPFEFSPYVANVKDEHKNTTRKSLQLINEIQLSSDTFSFAVIADNHYHFDNLGMVVDDINRKEEVLFVIICGDLTDKALLKEYELFYAVIEKLNKPWLTVIGNHDYLSNGEFVYKQMFGDCNYTFEFHQCKFILFDNVVWESDNNPDFKWLSGQLSDNERFNQVFVISHFPPFGDQIIGNFEKTFTTLLSENKVTLSIHGHVHYFSLDEHYDDGVHYLTLPWLNEPAYGIVTVHNRDFEVILIKL